MKSQPKLLNMKLVIILKRYENVILKHEYPELAKAQAGLRELAKQKIKFK